MNAPYFFLLVLTLWFHPTEQLSCHTSELNACFLPSILHEGGTLVPRNSYSLTSKCDKVWKHFWTCTDNYVSKCLSDVQRMIIEVVLKDMRISYYSLCDPNSKLRAAYEENLPCAADAFTLMLQTCTDNLENIIYIITGEDTEDSVNAGCCYFERAYHCLKENTEKLCGKGSYKTIKDYYKFFHAETINSVCFSHNPESKICRNYLNRNASASSETASYLGRFATRLLRYLQ